MRAAILREHGTVPEVAEHPDPTGPDVVQVLAAGMNPVDIRIATGTFGLERHEPPCRRASSSATMKPTLCLVVV